MKSPLSRIRDQLPEVSWPTLGRTVQIEVFLIHNSPDPEDYFFIFDFEEFVEKSREGIFVRPKLKVWAGRSDFDRRLFARQFRAAFAKEFEAARRILAEEDGRKSGWFSWSMVSEAASASVAGFVANVVLILATSAGKTIWSALPKPRMLASRSKERQLEDKIEETKGKVEAALTDLDVTLHPDLHAHAWQYGAPGPIAGMDRDAWPLPDYVHKHLGDKKTQSWW